MPSTGVIYIATGENYVQEALRSAQSLKCHMPNLPVTLFTDKAIKSAEFDSITLLQNPCYSTLDKVLNIGASPYERTLYLDTDTFICKDISELFQLLDRFDFAAAQTPVRKTYPVPEIPDSFPEFNGGVILFRKTPEVTKALTTWIRCYEADLEKNMIEYVHKETPKRQIRWQPDQPTLRKALYESSLRIATLSPEYNCRICSLGYVSGTVKILHGHHPDLKDLVHVINRETGRRCHFKKNGMITVLGPQGRVYYPSTEESSSSNGLNWLKKIFSGRVV